MPKLTCTCLQLVLVNVPKNLGAILGRSGSSVRILQMARQVTFRHYCFLLTYRPHSFEIKNVFKLQKAILNKTENTGSEYYQYIYCQQYNINSDSDNAYFLMSVIPMCLSNIQGGARNVIPLIVHVTHIYYYKNF